MTIANRLFLAVCLLLVISFPVAGQVTTGTPPFASFGGGPDVVNLGNLNVHLDVPVLNKAGRGMPFTYDLTYDTSIWVPITSGGVTSWNPVFNWGWIAQTQIKTGYISYSQWTQNCDTPPPVHQFIIYKNWVYYDAWGGNHPFYGQMEYDPTTCDNGTTSTLSSIAADGSGYTLSASLTGSTVSLHNIITKQGQVTNPPLNLVTGYSGVQATATDRNGNQISVSSTSNTATYTDTLGLAALTVSGSATPASSLNLSYTAPSGSPAFKVSYVTYTVRTNFQCAGKTEYGPSSNSLVDRITLPDGTFYQFYYERTPGFPGDYTGRLASVTLPTLGTISYTYTGGSSGNITCADGSTPGLTRVTPDGTWTYARTAGTGAAYSTTVTDPQSNVTQIQFQGIYETQRQVNKGSSTLLQTTNTCYNASASPCTATAIALPISQVDLYVQPAGASNLVAKYTTKYNTTYGMVTEQDNYDYSSSPPVTPLQKTAITYASLGNNIVAFQQQVTVTNGAGTIISKTNNNYDETAVTTTTGTPQHTTVTGSRGNLTSVNSYTNGTTFLTSRSTYFDTGMPQTTTDVNGAQTTYTYGNCGNSFPTNVAEPLSMSRSLAWNCTGGVQISSADENGQPATITYNDPYFWRPAQQNFADGGQTNWTYSGATSVTTTTKMNASQNIVTTSLLDSLGRASQTELTSDPHPDYTLTTYDSLGRIGTVYNPTRCNPPTSNCESTWGTTIYAYDTLNRVTSVTDPDNSVASASFTNNTVTLTDEAGKKRQIQTDALGRITQVTEDPGGLGYVSTYGYTALNSPTSVTNGSNQRTYAYDLLGRLTSETNPESGTVGYVYNSNGDLSTRTDARSIVTTYTFDALHRLTGKSYSDGEPYSVYTYDTSNPYGQTATNTVGRLAAVWAGSNPQYATWTAFSYDSMGRVATQWNCFAFPYSACPNVLTTGYQHDLAGNVIQMTYPSGMVVQQSFNSAGQLCDVAGSAPSNCGTPTNAWATSFVYNPASQAIGFTYGNSVSATFGYSNRLQRNSLQYVKGSNALFNLSYAFGSTGSNNGNISYITDNVDNGRSSAYIYDSLNRLSIASTVGSANYSQWGLSWTYDRYGNRTAQTVIAGTGSVPSNSVSVSPTTNHITSSGYAYDASGNMTNDGNNTLGYDGESRVITASNSGNSGSYNYGGDGLRVHQVSGSTVSNSIYSGSSVIGQYDNESGALQEYVYAGGQMLASVGATSNSNRSFEQGLSGWTSTGSSVQVITNSANAHSGSNYVQISTSSTASVSPPTFSVQPGDQVDFGGWIYLQSGSAAAVDWVLNALDANHNLVAAVVPVPWSVTTAGVWTYETGSYTVPSGVAYITFLGQVYEASGTTTARFDDGFVIVGTHYFQPDHLSTRLLTDSGGNVVGQQGHYPYGELWYPQNSITNWQFTSYQRDNESQNDYALMRSYVNRLARFSSPDPAGLAAADPSNPQSWNRYAYVTNNPMNLIDPSGLVDCNDGHYGCGNCQPQDGCSGDFYGSGNPGNGCSVSDAACGGGFGAGGAWGGPGTSQTGPLLAGGLVSLFDVIDFVNNHPDYCVPHNYCADLLNAFGISGGGFHFQLFPSSLRLPGESRLACIDRTQKALLGGTGQNVLGAASGVSLVTSIFTATTGPGGFAKVATVPGEVVNDLGAQISGDLIQTRAGTSIATRVIANGVSSGEILPEVGAAATKGANFLGKFAPLLTAVGVGLEGGFLVACR
jgi:RHS repeat-associated protein